jgi:hypothetical protein
LRIAESESEVFIFEPVSPKKFLRAMCDFAMDCGIFAVYVKRALPWIQSRNSARKGQRGGNETI